MSHASPGRLRVLSTLALMGAIRALVAERRLPAGLDIDVDFAPTRLLSRRIAAGEAVDVAILTEEAARDLLDKGFAAAEGIAPVALSYVGVAVRQGAPRPELSTVEACRRSLLGARSVCYSETGASGAVFLDIVRRLGIERQIAEKATIVPGGLTAELAARGEVELAVQQLSELKAVAGVDIAGAFPQNLQKPGVFSAAIFRASPRQELAQRFVSILRSADTASALMASGLELPGADIAMTSTMRR